MYGLVPPLGYLYLKILQHSWQYVTWQGFYDVLHLSLWKLTAKTNHLDMKSFQISSKILNDHYWSYLSTV